MPTYTEPPLTVADLEAMPEDGNRYELIDGELYVSTAPSYIHQVTLHRLQVAFAKYLEAHPVGEVVPGIGLVFDDYTGVIPDLVFFTNSRKSQILTGGRLTAAPEIVMEIVSPGAANERRDRSVKLHLYSKRGVHEYWLFDPQTRTLEVYRKLSEGGLAQSATLQAGDALTSPLLPDFRIDVDSLFA